MLTVQYLLNYEIYMKDIELNHELFSEKNSYGFETWIHLKDIDYKFVLSKQSDGALYHNYR